MEERALMDSARSVPPKMRMEWLHQRGIEVPRARPTTADSGLTLVGKWGRGPAAEVTGKDTLVVLTLGSEVALLSFAEPDSPRVLSEIQFPSLTAQSYLEDSLLYTSSNADLEVWNVADPTQPVKRGVLPAPVGDFWIRDTFLFYIRGDTFHAINIANSANLYELGSCVEAGSATTGSGNTVVVCQSGGFAFVDVSNPASPHEVGTYPCGHTLSATARGNLVCASYEETSDPYPVRFITLDISTPSSPRLLAKLNDLGGYDVFLDGPLAFVSGRAGQNEEPFQIISVVDSLHPALVDTCRTTDDFNWGVWDSPTLDRAFVADRYDGLAVVDISNLNNPQLDTSVMVAATAEDVFVDGQRCYVADGMAGLRILDVANPTKPTLVGGIDTSYGAASSYSVAVRDSIMYACWFYPYFRTYDVSDPAQPQLLGACFPPDEEPQVIVLGDTLAYAVIGYMFYVIDIAQSQAPEVVGTCGIGGDDLAVSDTLVYVASGSALEVVNVGKPDSPSVAGAWIGHTYGLDLRDTIVYAVGQRVLNTISVANPAAPYLLDSLPLSFITFDVVVVDSVAYVGGYQDLQTVDVSDARNLRLLDPSWTPPYAIHRLAYKQPYIYVACTDGGVGICETCALSVTEASHEPRWGSGLSVRPNPARSRVIVSGGPDGRPAAARILDAAGRVVLQKKGELSCNDIRIDVSRLPVGLYFVEVGNRNKTVGVCKFTKN